ncbi:hypothetical protein H7X69_00585 [Candidatus Saccharibacteria bacterium]|nr:hypothetical protein [Candidatus Saccharibacteria bacterium]
MAEQANPKYCEGCPVAAVLQTFIDEYFSDDPKADAGIDSLLAEPIPDFISDEKMADATDRAVFIMNRELIRSGVSDENLAKARETLVDSLDQLEGVAVESHCPKVQGRLA